MNILVYEHLRMEPMRGREYYYTYDILSYAFFPMCINTYYYAIEANRYCRLCIYVYFHIRLRKYSTKTMPCVVMFVWHL